VKELFDTVNAHDILDFIEISGYIVSCKLIYLFFSFYLISIIPVVSKYIVVLRRGTACRKTFQLLRLYSHSRTYSRLTYSFYLIIQRNFRVLSAVRRPCSDFMDMLQRLTNCRIIIIIIIIIKYFNPICPFSMARILSH